MIWKGRKNFHTCIIIICIISDNLNWKCIQSIIETSVWIASKSSNIKGRAQWTKLCGNSKFYIPHEYDIKIISSKFFFHSFKNAIHYYKEKYLHDAKKKLDLKYLTLAYKMMKFCGWKNSFSLVKIIPTFPRRHFLVENSNLISVRFGTLCILGTGRWHS